MGLGMAMNLQKHLKSTKSRPLLYHNRTISRGDPLKEAGAIPAESPRALVQNCDIVFLSLSDDEALTSTIEAIVSQDSGTSLEGKIIVAVLDKCPRTLSWDSAGFLQRISTADGAVVIE